MNTIAVLGPTHGSQLFLLSPNSFFPVRKLSCFPLKSLPTKPSKYVRLKAMTSPTCDEQTSNRKFEKLLPSPWTDRFHSVSVDVAVSLYTHTQTHTHIYEYSGGGRNEIIHIKLLKYLQQSSGSNHKK